MPDPIPWDELKKRSPDAQNSYFAKWQGQFKREPVSSGNIRGGDHLVCKGAIKILGKKYEHHLLCIDVKYSHDKGCWILVVMEYTTDLGPSGNPSGYSRASGSSDFTGFGKIKENTYTYEELEKKKTEKVIWPQELERFSVHEVIHQAKKRKGESWYDMLKNNCEHFVTWCKCGLNVSLQVKSWYTWARECLYSIVAGGKGVIASKYSVNMLSCYLGANVSDELFGLIGKEDAGFAVGIVLETGLAIYQIKKAFDQREKGFIESDELFYAKIVGILAKAVCRVGLGIGGSVAGAKVGVKIGTYFGGAVGAAFGPVGSTVGGAVGAIVGSPLGSLIGGFIGGAVGHLVGAGIEWWYENRQYLDG